MSTMEIARRVTEYECIMLVMDFDTMTQGQKNARIPKYQHCISALRTDIVIKLKPSSS